MLVLGGSDSIPLIGWCTLTLHRHLTMFVTCMRFSLTRGYTGTMEHLREGANALTNVLLGLRGMAWDLQKVLELAILVDERLSDKHTAVAHTFAAVQCGMVHTRDAFEVTNKRACALTSECAC